MQRFPTRPAKSLFTAAALLALAAAHAQDAPKYSNEFLAIGVGARALGMGHANVAAVNDVTAGYWNPAGLLGVEGDLQVGAMHSEYFAGIAKYDYLALAKPIDSASVIAFSYVRFGVDDIPNTTELIDNNGNIDYDRITSFSAADNAFIISYARKLKVPGLRIGANAKVDLSQRGSVRESLGLRFGCRLAIRSWAVAIRGHGARHHRNVQCMELFTWTSAHRTFSCTYRQ
jgi:hypothetical protein